MFTNVEGVLAIKVMISSHYCGRLVWAHCFSDFNWYIYHGRILLKSWFWLNTLLNTQWFCTPSKLWVVLRLLYNGTLSKVWIAQGKAVSLILANDSVEEKNTELRSYYERWSSKAWVGPHEVSLFVSASWWRWSLLITVPLISFSLLNTLNDGQCRQKMEWPLLCVWVGLEQSSVFSFQAFGLTMMCKHHAA